VLRRTVNPIQHQLKQEWVQLPGTEPEAWGGIFCGWAKDGPWIVEIDPGGPSQFQDPFASTGSGYALAHTAMTSVAHFKVGEQSLEGAKAIAYRAIETTCASAAWGVGMPVQMAVVTKDGIEEINDGDVKHTELSELVDLWKAKEVETLGELAPVTADGAGVSAGDEPEPSIDEKEIGNSIGASGRQVGRSQRSRSAASQGPGGEPNAADASHPPGPVANATPIQGGRLEAELDVARQGGPRSTESSS